MDGGWNAAFAVPITNSPEVLGAQVCGQAAMVCGGGGDQPLNPLFTFFLTHNVTVTVGCQTVSPLLTLQSCPNQNLLGKLRRHQQHSKA